MKTSFATILGIAAGALLAPAPAAHAQPATVSGSLGNFDVVNDTGQDAHGFEIEIGGLLPSDIVYAFNAERYGSPQLIPTTTGVIVRWTSPYDAAARQFSQATIAHTPNTPFAGSCYIWGANYDQAGCEHFGVSIGRNPGPAVYRWLVSNPANASALSPADPPVPVVFPVYYITPPAQPADAPVLVAEVQAPEPAETPSVYGDAQWIKVFKTQLTREVSLDELVSDNGIVPQDAAHVEVAWDIIQAEPATGGNQRRQRKQNQGGLDATTRSVVRRYELYAFTGAYDPLTHEALCADLTCTAPADGELGDFASAQMTAANVVVPSLTVSKSGNGNVNSGDRLVSCGSKCGTFYTAGAATTLTAAPASGSAFAGWTGGCAGSALTCNLTINEHVDVTATFLPLFSVSVKSSNKGTITSSDPALVCSSGSCSGRLMQGTSVTLTAIPPAGVAFLGWSGACSGTSSTCTLAIAANAQAQANFGK